jgi:hypothetical protein
MIDLHGIVPEMAAQIRQRRHRGKTSGSAAKSIATSHSQGDCSQRGSLDGERWGTAALAACNRAIVSSGTGGYRRIT